MRRLAVLAKIQLVDFFSKYKSGMGLRARRARLFLYLTLFCLAFPFIQMSVGVYQTFSILGRPESAVALMYLTVVLFMSFTAIPFLLSHFFYGGDLQFLAALPLPVEYIVLAKLSTLYCYLLIINSLVLAPAMILTGINYQLTALFWLLLFIVWLLVPLLPLLVSSVVALGTVKLFAPQGKKNLLSIFFGFGLLFLIIGIQLLMGGENSSVAEAWTLSIGGYFRPVQWVARLSAGSAREFLFFLLLNLLLAAGLWRLIPRLYRSALHSVNQTAVAKGRITYRQRRKAVQLLRRNLFILLRQPVFMMNTLLILAVPCLMLLIAVFTGELPIDLMVLPENRNRLVVLFVTVTAAPALLLNLSATAITREGRTFWETKVLPVEVWDNLRSRMWTTLIVNVIASLLIGLPVVLLFGIEWPVILSGAFFIFTLTRVLATIDLLINLYRPYLDWTNPAAAIKNNLNVLFSLALRPLFLAVPYFFSFCWTALGEEKVLCLSGLVFLLLHFLIFGSCKDLMIRKFNQIVA